MWENLRQDPAQIGMGVAECHGRTHWRRQRRQRPVPVVSHDGQPSGWDCAPASGRILVENWRSVFKVIGLRQRTWCLGLRRLQNSQGSVKQAGTFRTGEDAMRLRGLEVRQLAGKQGIVRQRENPAKNRVIDVTRKELIGSDSNDAILREIGPQEASQK